MPIGAEKVIPINVSMTVNGKPPQASESTETRPKRPPAIKTKKTTKATSQPSESILKPFFVQRTGNEVATNIKTINAVARAGRHCSS